MARSEDIKNKRLDVAWKGLAVRGVGGDAQLADDLGSCVSSPCLSGPRARARWGTRAQPRPRPRRRSPGVHSPFLQEVTR
jgi:hypothetical protein